MSKPPPPAPAAFGPPRPDAVVTLLISEDSLPGAQTLLYSIKLHSRKQKKKRRDGGTEHRYPPELVVLASSPGASAGARSALLPSFCHRVFDVEPFPPLRRAEVGGGEVGGGGEGGGGEEEDGGDGDGGKKGPPAAAAGGSGPGLTRLRAFGLEPYGAVLYVDADCVAVQDVRPLLSLGRGGGGEVGDGTRSPLLGAARDPSHPDRLDAGAMVIRPSSSAMADLLARAAESIGPGGGGGDGDDDAGAVLGAHFSVGGGGGGASGIAMLPLGTEGDWRAAGGDDGDGAGPTIVRLGSPRPWEVPATAAAAASASAGGEQEEGGGAAAEKSLNSLWRDLHRRSRSYADEDRARREEERRKRGEAEEKRRRKTEELRRAEELRKAEEASGGGRGKGTDWSEHKKVTKRYRELRRGGMGSADAMAAARAEFGTDEEDDGDVMKKVSAVFGSQKY